MTNDDDSFTIYNRPTKEVLLMHVYIIYYNQWDFIQNGIDH